MPLQSLHIYGNHLRHPNSTVNVCLEDQHTLYHWKRGSCGNTTLVVFISWHPYISRLAPAGTITVKYFTIFIRLLNGGTLPQEWSQICKSIVCNSAVRRAFYTSKITTKIKLRLLDFWDYFGVEKMSYDRIITEYIQSTKNSKIFAKF